MPNTKLRWPAPWPESRDRWGGSTGEGPHGTRCTNGPAFVEATVRSFSRRCLYPGQDGPRRRWVYAPPAIANRPVELPGSARSLSRKHSISRGQRSVPSMGLARSTTRRRRAGRSARTPPSHEPFSHLATKAWVAESCEYARLVPRRHAKLRKPPRPGTRRQRRWSPRPAGRRCPGFSCSDGRHEILVQLRAGCFPKSEPSPVTFPGSMRQIGQVLAPGFQTRRCHVLGSRDWCTTAMTSIHSGRIR